MFIYDDIIFRWAKVLSIRQNVIKQKKKNVLVLKVERKSPEIIDIKRTQMQFQKGFYLIVTPFRQAEIPMLMRNF